LLAQIGRALERIVIQVLKLNEPVGDIAASAQEQATGLNEVNTAVNLDLPRFSGEAFATKNSPLF
jgi:methyl-accepting chemotaxis protein